MADFTLWLDKGKKQVDPRMFSTKAEEMAKAIGREDNRKNKSTQLRRFFDELLRINTRAQSENDDWNITQPLVHMMVAKVAYAQGRGLVTESFVDVMRSGITKIDDKDDLQVFTSFLEAFMGFYKLYRPQ